VFRAHFFTSGRPVLKINKCSEKERHHASTKQLVNEYDEPMLEEATEGCFVFDSKLGAES